MEKLPIYILSFFCLLACNQSAEITEEERIEKINFYGNLLRDQANKEYQVYVDSIIALDPNTADWYRIKSIGSTKLGEYELSFPNLQKAIALDSANLEYAGWVMLGIYRDFDRAIEYLEAYDATTPDFVDYPTAENIHYLLGIARKEKGQYLRAIQEFDLCIDYEKEQVTKNEMAYAYKGICLYELGKYDASIKILNEAVSLNNLRAIPHYYLGENYAKKKQLSKAKRHYKEASDIVAKSLQLTHPYREIFNEMTEEKIQDAIKRLPVQ